MHEEAHEKLCEMRECLIDAAKANMEMGLDKVNTQEMGQVVDMIKDLYEAEKYYKEACYYGSIVDAMNEASEKEEHSDRMGYTKRPVWLNPMKAAWDEKESNWTPKPEMSNMRMGYPIEDKDKMSHDDRYGKAYAEYRKARRHYMESKTPSDKEMMDEKATDHMADSIHTMREIWDTADSTLRKKMKADLQKLVGEMVV